MTPEQLNEKQNYLLSGLMALLIVNLETCMWLRLVWLAVAIVMFIQFKRI